MVVKGASIAPEKVRGPRARARLISTDRRSRLDLGAMNGPQRRPQRSVLRYSVGSLLAAVLVTGAGLGWIVRGAAIQRDAIAVIERSGGHVEYSSSRLIPQRLADQYGLAITDAGLDHLHRMSNLTSLHLSGTSVTDRGIARLRTFTRLRELQLPGTGITDNGLTEIAGLSEMRILSVGGTGITDAGLSHPEGMVKLEELYLDRTALTDTEAHSTEAIQRFQDCLRASDPRYLRRGRDTSKSSATGTH